MPVRKFLPCWKITIVLYGCSVENGRTQEIILEKWTRATAEKDM